ncbi:SipW-dependent-type signal peptide-containing protein [Halorubrum sp. F4]|uniref:SipW-dependent-type signal peptide-containing protein n=1 Tax=Halorubrum sp. F4 TaxID=2989715 RepID=UPI0024811484|nr:SipW-dependent-type signal peptide-containing protein [Halorubrum sp. F4]
MSDRTPTKVLAFASAVALVIAGISGGAVTYASFTDSGNVAVTFSVGNVPEDPEPDFAGDGTPTVETNRNGTETDGDAETDRKTESGPDDGDPRTDEGTDDETTNDTSTQGTETNDTSTQGTETSERSENHTSTHESSTNNESSTEPSTNDESTIDRIVVRDRSESTSRRSSHEDGAFFVSKPTRDVMSGGDER